MKVVKYWGGLGNQMFQYSFHKYLELSESDVKADLSWYEQINSANRPYMLDRFGIKLDVVDKDTAYRLRDCEKDFFSRVRRKVFGKRTFVSEKTWDEKGDVFDGDVYLEGYWQKYEYVKKVYDQIISDFDFSAIKNNSIIQAYEKTIFSRKTVSIHVRGGDYLDEVNAPIFGGICTPNYYKRALDYLNQIENDLHFVVFSNDQSYARRILGGLDAVYVESSAEDNALIDLFLMKCCRHNIIANSTFSWWGAFLNDNPEKIVVMPHKWIYEDTSEPLQYRNCICI